MFFSYVLSFVYVAIYWNNHHHMLQATHAVSGRVLWANMHLLFWLSLFPFATAWLGEHHAASQPAALYGAVLLMASIAYWLLQQAIIAGEGAGSLLQEAVGRDWKGRLSPPAYLAGMVAARWWPWLAEAVYVLVALVWLVPDRRIETAMRHRQGD